MPVPKSNTDKQVPWTKEKSGLLAPVNPPTFDSPLVHIFWGPGQKTGDGGTYQAPDPKSWFNLSPLMIPQVVRFIYAAKPSYGSDDYADDDSGTKPPPPGLWVYTNTVQWGIQPALKLAYQGPRIPFTNEPVHSMNPDLNLYAEVQVFGDLGAGVMWNPIGDATAFYGSITLNGAFNPNQRVQVRNADGTGSPYYTGPIDGCPYFDMLVWRSVSWRRHRTDNGFEVFVAGFQSFNPPGTSGTAPPRCSFTDYKGTPGTEHPIADYMAILGNTGPC